MIRRSPRKRAGNDPALLPFAQTLTEPSFQSLMSKASGQKAAFSKSKTEAEQKAEVRERRQGVESPNMILADAVGTLAFAAVCLMPAPNVQLSTERK